MRLPALQLELRLLMPSGLSSLPWIAGSCVLMFGCATIKVGRAPDSREGAPRTIAIVGFGGIGDVQPGTAQSEPVFRGCLEAIIEAGRVPVEGRYVHSVARAALWNGAQVDGRPKRVRALGEVIGAEALLTGWIRLLPDSLRVTKLVVSFWSSATGREFANARLESSDGLEPYDAGGRACRALVLGRKE